MIPVLPVFIPGVDLEGNEDTDHDEENFADGIGELSGDPVPYLFGRQVLKELLVDFAEDACPIISFFLFDWLRNFSSIQPFYLDLQILDRGIYRFSQVFVKVADIGSGTILLGFDKI